MNAFERTVVVLFCTSLVGATALLGIMTLLGTMARADVGLPQVFADYMVLLSTAPSSPKTPN